MSELTESQWQVLWYTVAGYSCHEIAKRLGLEVGTVWSRRYRTRTKLGAKTGNEVKCKFYELLKGEGK